MTAVKIKSPLLNRVGRFWQCIYEKWLWFLLIDVQHNGNVSSTEAKRRARFLLGHRTRLILTHFQVHLPPHPLSLTTAIALPGNGKARDLTDSNRRSRGEG